MIEAIDQILHFGPVVLLTSTCAWLLLATQRTSAMIGTKAYGFGGSPRQRLAQSLFRGAVVGALVGLGAYAVDPNWFPFQPLTGEDLVVRVLGLIVAAGGQVFTVLAQSGMGRRWRVGVPEAAPDALVTTGLFGVSRNPVFLGMLAMAIGLAVAVPSPMMITCAGAFWVACEIQVRDEERFLERSFGTAYLAYKRAVRRWI